MGYGNQKSSRPVSRILYLHPSRNEGFYHLSGRSTPRHRASHPQSPVYAIFQPVRRTACNVTITTGRLLLCLLTLARRRQGYGGRSFSSPLLCPHKHLLIQKYGALSCPDFPPLPAMPERATERSTAYLCMSNEPSLPQIHIL